MSSTTTVGLVGVGGQGVLLAARALAATAAAAGLDVKSSEIKGMSQRGGSVLSTVRFGERVWSPTSPQMELAIALELLEAHRALEILAPGGALVCSATTRIPPGSVLRREEQYPEGLTEEAAAAGHRLLAIDAEGIARELGIPGRTNIVLLGAASTVLPFSAEEWQRGLESTVRARHLEVNLRAFALGREAANDEEVAP